MLCWDLIYMKTSVGLGFGSETSEQTVMKFEMFENITRIDDCSLSCKEMTDVKGAVSIRTRITVK